MAKTRGRAGRIYRDAAGQDLQPALPNGDRLCGVGGGCGRWVGSGHALPFLAAALQTMDRPKSAAADPAPDLAKDQGRLMNQEKVSIITVFYNSARTLERTLQSVLDQSCGDIEHIVVDGGLTDGSRQLIEKYAERLAWWVSQPDGGISAAFNKGLARATGFAGRVAQCR